MLDRLGLIDRWSEFGDPVVVGAVAHDLVVEADIDMEIYCDEVAVAHGFRILSACAEIEGVWRARFMNAFSSHAVRRVTGAGAVGPEDGYYWQLHVGHEGVDWGIDMWSLPRDHPGPRGVDMIEPLRAAMTPERRDAILAIKEEALDRGRSLAGVWVYMAVIEHGITDYDDFISWFESEPKRGLSNWLPRPAS